MGVGWRLLLCIGVPCYIVLFTDVSVLRVVTRCVIIDVLLFIGVYGCLLMFVVFVVVCRITVFTVVACVWCYLL